MGSGPPEVYPLPVSFPEIYGPLVEDARGFLRDLPHEGFRSDEHRETVITQIDAVGLPVDNYRSLAYKQNEKGKENTLGSWGIGSKNFGEFSVYELLERQIPEQRLSTIAHEGAHANSPLQKENAYLFGGEAERARAEKYVWQLANQSLITGKYMTGYHKYLSQQLTLGKIDYRTFAEETQAIATELAMTNRAKLIQVEDAQRDKIGRMHLMGALPASFEPVDLLSRVAPDGHVEVGGIDTQLIALVRGVNNFAELLEHVGNLKAQFYPDESLAVAQKRWNMQMQALQHMWIIEMQRRFEQEARQAREEA